MKIIKFFILLLFITLRLRFFTLEILYQDGEARHRLMRSV